MARKTTEDMEIESLCAVRRIAAMTTEEEMEDGGTDEDFRSTLNALIREAREITGIDPGHEKVYCTFCGGKPGEDCDCKEPKEGTK